MPFPTHVERTQRFRRPVAVLQLRQLPDPAVSCASCLFRPLTAPPHPFAACFRRVCCRRRRITTFFTSLYRALRRGARCVHTGVVLHVCQWCGLTHLFGVLLLRVPSTSAVLQLYPEFPEQVEMLTTAAVRCGFTGGLVVDYPHSSKARKHYLCLFAGLDGAQVPAGRSAEESKSQSLFDLRRSKFKVRCGRGLRGRSRRSCVMPIQTGAPPRTRTEEEDGQGFPRTCQVQVRDCAAQCAWARVCSGFHERGGEGGGGLACVPCPPHRATPLHTCCVPQGLGAAKERDAAAARQERAA